jgi:hypothetical protein
MTGKAGLQAAVQPGKDWTVVLRRQPARMVDGRPQSGYTDAFELICCDCGDDPGLGYRDVSPRLRQIRGPYRSRRASPPMTSTSGTTGGRRLAQAPELWVMPRRENGKRHRAPMGGTAAPAPVPVWMMGRLPCSLSRRP